MPGTGSGTIDIAPCSAYSRLVAPSSPTQRRAQPHINQHTCPRSRIRGFRGRPPRRVPSAVKVTQPAALKNQQLVLVWTLASVETHDRAESGCTPCDVSTPALASSREAAPLSSSRVAKRMGVNRFACAVGCMMTRREGAFLRKRAPPSDGGGGTVLSGASEAAACGCGIGSNADVVVA